MKKYIYLLVAVLILLLMAACAMPQSTYQELFPKMYQSSPACIMILPPMNESTGADAKEYFACSLSESIGLKGYYVLPVEATFGVLREEGLYDTENMNAAVLKNLKEHFGADAVLFSTIQEWDKSWAITSGSLNITSKFALLSTATADTLWDFTMKTNVSIGSQSNNILVAALESAIKTAIEDYFPNCLSANTQTMEYAMPYGKHHPGFNTDGTKPIVPNKRGSLSISK
ncbi:MAG: DUF799 family lipoprotein [Candidatus Cloacimonetes bacterium]|jgi:hypothetical protein|nr:DUF799 domain-containing protein [Candidatus Cloacimonadota bacterium]MDY0336467.1 DUF799 family lipoprotein [Candidatus Cloacimonadaceae bacterium]MDD2543063.1 DUF799 family lipoprotein [Candidatus Cloacimonadota bacterium]MDD3096547.1 DUF799 family lipoprotein [Candidatus Cloacimonadota bacterium]MDD4034424.1 DUF799 family lipoprotein [Candidatus Cloacimonadota bacterium]